MDVYSIFLPKITNSVFIISMVEQLRHMDMLLELQAELFANMLKEAVSFVVLLCDQFQWYGRQFGMYLRNI